METLLTKLGALAPQIESFVVAINNAHNEGIDEFNTLVDECEALKADLVEQKKRDTVLEELIFEQNKLIENLTQSNTTLKANFNKASAELRALQLLDPKRLAKVNKAQKKQIAEAKESNTKLEEARKKALKITKTLLEEAKSNGGVYIHQDPKNGNTLRFIPSLFVAKKNTFGAVPETPILEFHHKDRGITRQGLLGVDGKIIWCDATNSEPTRQESDIALNLILNECKKQKIKVPKISEVA
tara:strand:- start:268 stop:993 length:726 start_codon:yes stop_codon:yes gene_type:complete